MVWVGGWTKTIFMLFSTQVGVVVEVGAELGKNQRSNKNRNKNFVLTPLHKSPSQNQLRGQILPPPLGKQGMKGMWAIFIIGMQLFY